MLNFARAGLNFYSDITHQHVAMRTFSIVPGIGIYWFLLAYKNPGLWNHSARVI